MGRQAERMLAFVSSARFERGRGHLEFEGRDLQVLPFWGSRADAVAAAAPTS